MPLSGKSVVQNYWECCAIRTLQIGRQLHNFLSVAFGAGSAYHSSQLNDRSQSEAGLKRLTRQSIGFQVAQKLI